MINDIYALMTIQHSLIKILDICWDGKLIPIINHLAGQLKYKRRMNPPTLFMTGSPSVLQIFEEN